VIEDPHWIYPGEVLKLPAGSSAAPAAEAGRPEAPTDPNATTVFDPRRFQQKRGEWKSANLLKSRVAVRAGEYLASPFAWSVGGPVGSGRVLKTAESQIVIPTLGDRPYQSHEPVFLRLPAGAHRADGQRFMTFELGPVLPGQGQVVIVTGVVVLKEDPGVGDARAVILQRFRPIRDGQGVMPIDSLIPRLDQHPAAVEYGAATKLAWMQDNPVIAQIGSYVILSSTAKDGLVTGDQVALLTSLGAGETGEQHTPEVAGVLQVLRVTAFGTSAILLNRSQADIIVGMPGRVTAKMP
jgi:hypothetical protein